MSLDSTKADEIALEIKEAIAEALAAGSAAGARSLAREHVLSSFGLLEAVLDEVERGGGLRRLA